MWVASAVDAWRTNAAAASTDPTSLGIECPYQTPGECTAFYTGLGYGTGAAAQGVAPLSTGLSGASAALNKQLPSKAQQKKQAKQLADFRKGGKQLTTGTAQLGSGLGQLGAGDTAVLRSTGGRQRFALDGAGEALLIRMLPKTPDAAGASAPSIDSPRDAPQ